MILGTVHIYQCRFC